MATKLFLRSTKNNNISNYYDMVIAAGAALNTDVVDTVASGTEIQWTEISAGSIVAWISGRVPVGGFTLTSTDISIWAQESNMSANCGGRYRVFIRTAAGVETEIGGGPFSDGVEFSPTAATEMTWAGNVTDQVFAENDRILVKIYITNVGTMGGGFTCTLTFNAADAATGDSFFNIAETVAFKAEEIPIGTNISSHPTFFSPRLPAPAAILTIAINLLQSTLAPVEVPFSQTDWPVPQRTTSQLVVDISSRPQEDGNPPISVVDWRNPDIRKYPTLTWLNNNLQDTLEPEESVPFTPVNFPNPILKQVIGLTWLNNNLENTLTPAVEVLPFRQSDWPIPQRKRSISIDISSRLQVDDKVAFKQTEWPNPLKDHKPVNRGYIQEKPQYYPTEPFLGESCPIMLGIGAPGDITCFTLFGLEANPFPFNLQSQDNPPLNLKRNFVPTWIQPRPFYYDVEVVEPVGKQSTANPSVISRRQNAGFIQTRPSYYIEPSGTPFISQNQWPNPIRKSGIIIVDSTTTPGQSPDVGVPNRQRDWPNPLLRRKTGFPYTDFYVIDDNLPPLVQSTALPLRKRPFVPTWIYGIQFGEINPTRIFNYPNPIIVKQQVHTWINNLLQSTLEPAIGEKPFFQNEWPNPVIASKILHIGWIQERKFYSDEPPLPIRQIDWPVFVRLKRNDVGFINFKIPSSDPIFTSITDVPLRQKGVALSWIDNPILFATVVPGLAPFNQNNWANPTRKITNFNILTIAGQNFILFPQGFGRKICVLVRLEEFDLLVGIDEFDLKARMEEFNIETGGTECE